MYRQVARGERAELHFEVGEGRWPSTSDTRASSWTRSPPRRWRPSRAWGITSTSPRCGPARRCSTSARDRAPTSSARPCWSASRAASSASTSPTSSSTRPRGLRRDGFPQVEFVEARIEELPFEDASFDAVISNGVINLSPAKGRVFAEAARVLRPGGRLAIADIVSGRPLKERTRRNVELWAACIAGAIPRSNYLEALEAHGLQVKEVRENDYRFISERALDACSTYEVESISCSPPSPERSSHAAAVVPRLSRRGAPGAAGGVPLPRLPARGHRRREARLPRRRRRRGRPDRARDADAQRRRRAAPLRLEPLQLRLPRARPLAPDRARASAPRASTSSTWPTTRGGRGSRR